MNLNDLDNKIRVKSMILMMLSRKGGCVIIINSESMLISNILMIKSIDYFPFHFMDLFHNFNDQRIKEELSSEVKAAYTLCTSHMYLAYKLRNSYVHVRLRDTCT